VAVKSIFHSRLGRHVKFGRKPAVHNRRTFRSGLVLARHLDNLGPAPTATNDYTAAVEKRVGGSSDWGMMGNDNAGDCVFADDGHELMIITANTGEIVIPTTAQILAQYSAETGYNPDDPSTDNGADETTDCSYLVSNGLLGYKADDTAMVDPTNLDHVTWLIQLFGACKFGVNWTQQMMDQFNSGQIITADPNGEVLGGHDVPGVLRQGDKWWIVTWGERVPVDPGFIAAAEEAHGLLWCNWCNSQGVSPPGLDLAALDGDLKALS
jgi:hypothetical protein